MDYREAIQFLSSLQIFGMTFGLETVRQLAALVGDPQNQLRFIHVAGTNGKGSTCAIMESILYRAFYRVGLYTSPHLVTFRERIQVDGQPITEEEVVRLVKKIQPLLKKFPAEKHPTFFEVVTVMALLHFARKRCRMVVWETGLGGRFDATNIVTPEVSVITNVELDHEKWLGATIPQIAAEKAGIIKPKVPVVAGVMAEEALAVIRETAEKQGAPLIVCDPKVRSLDDVAGLIKKLPLPGRHQARNAALAITALRAVPDLPFIDLGAIERGLDEVHWPGRFEAIPVAPERVVVLDGAHNPAGVAVLLETFGDVFPCERPTFVLAAMQDKNWRRMCQMIAPGAGRIFVCGLSTSRAVTPADLEEACAAANPNVEIVRSVNFQEVLPQIAETRLVVVTGSFYLVGEARQHFRFLPSNENERALNDWSERKNL